MQETLGKYAVMGMIHQNNPDVASMTSYHIFDRQRVKKHRDRAAERFAEHDFLLREVAARVADRLLDVKRDFPIALNLGAYNGFLSEYIPKEAGIRTLVQTDYSHALLKDAKGLKLVADEEVLPFADNSFDLILCPASLHTVNDLPGSLIQMYRALKPGGMMLAVMPGGESLKELRASLEYAELAITGGISPHVSPFIDVKDAGALLQRAGFILPVADTDILTIAYQQPLKLMADLRGCGQNNSINASRKQFMRRDVFYAAMEHYQATYQHDGRYMATAELITLTGWKPDAHNQQETH